MKSETFASIIKKSKKTLLTFFLSSNLILLATGSAELNPATDSAVLEEQSTPSAQVQSEESVESNIAHEPKIDPTGSFYENELIIKFKEGFPKEGQKGILKALNAEILRDNDQMKAMLLKVDPTEREKTMEALKKNPNVLSVGLNSVATLQEGGGGGGNPNPSGCRPYDYYYCEGFQWAVDMIEAPSVWWHGSVGSSSQTVAIVDSGVDYNHYDLVLKVIKGRDVWSDDNDPLDEHGHGTAVAGIIGARTWNIAGIAGLDWLSKILAIKVTDAAGNGSAWSIAEGIWYAVGFSNPSVRVINVSASVFDDNQQLIKAAVDAANGSGIYVVAAVQNNFTTRNCWMEFPAAYYGVISVVAIDSYEPPTHWVSGCTGNVKDGQTYQKVQLSAPGARIFTLWKQSGIGYQPPPNTDPGSTSMAAPFVSGTISLLKAYGCSNIRQDLLDGAWDWGTNGWDSTYGYGEVKAYRSLVLGCLN